ncbi:hypothetical protein FDA94_28595 [Herbidospora galbida]|uniref:Uncharacterized protein n=1 Tax=Herbidospora galbida TaxID=2575442 RepID=A0A4U3M711_9ACTN|nr:hypothetical protein [Herbidospora galbida]TKK84591.1 hypothetical protein FDA94_28595 [Herbidospora galbida]
MTNSTTEKSFIGVPIEGYVYSVQKVDQLPVEQLAPLFQAIQDDPTILRYGWTQYTPYFNDGEVCEFSAGDVWFLTEQNKSELDEEGVPEDEVDYDDFAVSWNDSLGKRPRTWDYQARQYIYGDYSGPDEARYDHCMALSEAVTSGKFDHALLRLFGDHAKITVHKDRIVVDEYDHD